MSPHPTPLVPDHTAVRVALWRALHVLIDGKPHIFSDQIGAALVAEANWTQRPDMDPKFSKQMRSSIVARARFIEDLLQEKMKEGVTQYIILGAGLDTFAQRRPDLASSIQLFEVDQEQTQAWKQKRLTELGFPIPEWLHFVPYQLETKNTLWDQLIQSGFDPTKPAYVVSTGVSMYLTKEANRSTFSLLSKLAQGSTFVSTFMLTLELLDPKEKTIMECVMKKTSEAGTPFVSLFSPAEIQEMAIAAGFKSATCISGQELFRMFFSNRSDQLDPGKAEGFILANT